MRILIASNKPEVFDFKTAAEIIEQTGHSYKMANEFFDHRGQIDWRLLEHSYDYDLGMGCFYLGRVPAHHTANVQTSRRWINFHPGCLPSMRGRNLCYWAIKQNKEYHGVTAHWMDPNFDTGDVIQMSLFQISEWMNAGDLIRLGGKAANELFLKILQEVCFGNKLSSIKQGKGTYYPAEKINDFVDLPPSVAREIRAICTDKYPAKTVIGGRTYIIKPEDSNV